MGKIILNGNEYVTSTIRGFPPLIYSDDEREIGVWRDGKPLYQKYITFTSVTISSINTWTTLTDVSNLNIGKLVDIFYRSETYGYITRECVTKISNGNLQVYSGNTGWACDSAVIYYTKTTDTPGSGKYSAVGDLMHHYSTTEQVVGTWINGETLYEKTFSKTYTSGETDLSINWGITGIQVLNIWGILIPSDTPTSRVIIGSNYDVSNLVIFKGVGGTGVTVARGNSAYFGSTPTVYITIQYTKSSS